MRSRGDGAWSALAISRLDPRQRRQWLFLQKQWLISPVTTGWLGGVHAPVRVLQTYLMLASRLAESQALASGIRYVTLLREPTRRFLSEFYETYDGWEAHHGTPPRLMRGSECSMRLAEPPDRVRDRVSTTHKRTLRRAVHALAPVREYGSIVKHEHWHTQPGDYRSRKSVHVLMMSCAHCVQQPATRRTR